MFDSYKSTITEENMFKELLQCTDTMAVDLTKLFSVTTDSASATIRINNGTVALLKNDFIKHRNMGIRMKLLCVVHQEALYMRSTNV